MRKSYLATLAYILLGVIDRGGHTRISMKETFARMRDRTILQWLRSQFPIVDRFVTDDDQNRRVGEALFRYAGAADPDKYGIENSGLCFLAAVMVELLLQDDPDAPGD